MYLEKSQDLFKEKIVVHQIMINEKVIKGFEEKDELKIRVLGKDFLIKKFVIKKTDNPVQETTTRGGVYKEEKTGYKIKAVTEDFSISDIFSEIMLGPNTQFQEMRIFHDRLDGLALIANLTSTFQSKDSIELTMSLIRTEQN